MPKSTYITRAKKRFLEGTSYRVPVEAVQRGRRTLEQWAEILNEERDLEMLKSTMSRTVVSQPVRGMRPHV
jgi:hypothetical protein